MVGDSGEGSSDGRDADERPPILGRWSRLYAVVIGELVVVIALLALLTWWAS